MVTSNKDPREEVIQAWYMDDSDEDQRLPHHKEPKEFVSLDKLAELGGLSWKLDADNHETDPELKKIREDRGYTYKVKKGGMIILPAGMYHRFTLNESNYIKALRFFVGEPVWTPYNRPHDHLPARGIYQRLFCKRMLPITPLMLLHRMSFCC